MVTNATLSAKPRDGRGKGNARKLRAQGQVPAVLYGHGEATRPLTVNAHELNRLFARIHVENTIIDLNVEGEGEVKALVREVQSHPARGTILHVDFYQIHSGEKVTVSIPIVLTGTPAGVRQGGILQQQMDEIEIRCLPDAIPDEIAAEVSGLGIGDSIHVRDLSLPAGIEVLVDEDRTVCSVLPPTVSAEGAGAEGGSSEPEVIRRRKEEE